MLTITLILSASLPAAEPARRLPVAAVRKLPVAAAPDDAPRVRRVELHGLWYDRHPDGRLDYCKECNKGKLPPAGSVVTHEEHQAIVAAGVVPAPGVAAPQPLFRRASSGGFHVGHDCPACGRPQFVVSGAGPGGTHRHRCPVDGTEWFH